MCSEALDARRRGNKLSLKANLEGAQCAGEYGDFVDSTHHANDTIAAAAEITPYRIALFGYI